MNFDVRRQQLIQKLDSNGDGLQVRDLKKLDPNGDGRLDRSEAAAAEISDPEDISAVNQALHKAHEQGSGDMEPVELTFSAPPHPGALKKGNGPPKTFPCGVCL